MTMHNMHYRFLFPMDLATELQHWRVSHQGLPGFRKGLGFERYIPTLKFGYDTFTLDHAHDQVALLSELCHKYKDRVSAFDRIDWCEAKLLVSAVWDRMDSSGSSVDALADVYEVSGPASRARSRRKLS